VPENAGLAHFGQALMNKNFLLISSKK